MVVLQAVSKCFPCWPQGTSSGFRGNNSEISRFDIQYYSENFKILDLGSCSDHKNSELWPTVSRFGTGSCGWTLKLQVELHPTVNFMKHNCYGLWKVHSNQPAPKIQDWKCSHVSGNWKPSVGCTGPYPNHPKPKKLLAGYSTSWTQADPRLPRHLQRHWNGFLFGILLLTGDWRSHPGCGVVSLQEPRHVQAAGLSEETGYSVG